MKKGAKRAGREGAADAFAARLVEVLRSAEFQMSVIQRLVAASMNAADGHLVVELAVDRIWEERGSPDSLAGRLMREVEAGCAQYADLRGRPYRKMVGPIIRGWPVLMRAAREAGLTREEGYAVVRGKEAAIQLRAVAKAKFGPRNERLVHFKVAPLRRRVRKRPDEEKPPDGELPAVKPV